MSPLRRAVAEVPIVAALIAGAWLVTPAGSAVCLSILTLWVWVDPLVRHVWRRSELAATTIQPRRGDRRRPDGLCPGVGADDMDGVHQEATDTEPADN